MFSSDDEAGTPDVFVEEDAPPRPVQECLKIYETEVKRRECMVQCSMVY